MLEGARRKTRPRLHDLYDAFRAIVYLLDSGCTWRHLPGDCPPWRSVHEYFSQWTSEVSGSPTLLERALLEAGLAPQAERLRILLKRPGQRES